MDYGVNGRTYLVTGASGGLGLASARALVDGGANVVIASRDQERIDRVAASLEAPDRVRGVVADLADEQAPARLVAEARDAFGGLSGAVISVGGPLPGVWRTRRRISGAARSRASSWAVCGWRVPYWTNPSTQLSRWR